LSAEDGSKPEDDDELEAFCWNLVLLSLLGLSSPSAPNAFCFGGLPRFLAAVC
jgi:hypothetical protein